MKFLSYNSQPGQEIFIHIYAMAGNSHSCHIYSMAGNSHSHHIYAMAIIQFGLITTFTSIKSKIVPIFAERI